MPQDFRVWNLWLVRKTFDKRNTFSMISCSCSEVARVLRLQRVPVLLEKLELSTCTCS